MHSSATPDPSSPEALLELINHLLSVLLLNSPYLRPFAARWQLLRSKLTSLQILLPSLSSSAHWSGNLLLDTLLPNLLSSLHRIESLYDQCADPSFNGGKLRMQSDLDMVSGAVSTHLHDLDLLLRSGVLHHSNAIVLSQPGPSTGKEDVQLFVRDIFTRLQIGGVEFKKKALESLIQLLADDEKATAAAVVAKEGNVAYLIQLLDHHYSPLIREQAVNAVSLLASATAETRKCVFDGGGLGPLLRILEIGSTPLKEKAAIALESITADEENAWAISAYGGIPLLIDACRATSPSVQSHAAGAIRNAACVEDVRKALAEEGAVPVLVQLLSSTAAVVQKKAAAVLSILAESGGYFRALIIQERGLQKLMRLIQDSPSSDAVESVLRAITALAATESVVWILSASTTFVVQIGELIKHGSMSLQHLSTSLLAKLTLSDGNKRAIDGTMFSLLKLMEWPKPPGLQESATAALVSLLSVRTSRKELVKDEKSLMRLVKMLDPTCESVPKQLPVAVVAAIVASGSKGCRRRLMAAGAQQHLQKLAEMEVAGARKAAQKLAGSRIKTIFSMNRR